MRNFTILIAFLAASGTLSIPQPVVHAADTTSSHAARGKRLVFEGTVLKVGPPAPPSGLFAFYRLAKYRVDRVLIGSYSSPEIVVDHLVLTTRELEGIEEGSHVCVSAIEKKKLFTITFVPGIRDQGEVVRRFYEGDHVTLGACGSPNVTIEAAQLQVAAQILYKQGRVSRATG